MKKILVLVIVAGMLSAGAAMAESIAVIPGLKGFGTDTRAAYGNNQNPEICIVNTLNPTTSLISSTRLDTNGNSVNVYEGGFKSCVEWNRNNKLILFEIAGYIDVQGVVKSDNNHITIAGQTAPAPGVTIKGCIFHINGQHILLHHLRLRQGYFDYDADWNYKDVVNLGWGGMAGNFVMDHCSLSWAMDETIGAYLGSSLTPPCLSSDGSNLTFSNNIFGEPHHKAKLDDPGYTGKNFLLSCRDNVAIIKNLFISGYTRNPVIHTAGTYVVNNNLIYNPGCFNFKMGNQGGAIKITAIGNVVKRGPNSGRGHRSSYEKIPAIKKINTNSEIYLYDNRDETGTPANAADWSHVRLWGKPPPNESDIKVLIPPMTIEGYESIPSSQLENELSDKIGAYPAFRDAVDIRFFNEVASDGTKGRFVTGGDSLSASDWPVLAENTRTLVLPANPHADKDSDGYTNLEEWLHAYAAEVEGKEYEEADTTTPKVTVNSDAAENKFTNTFLYRIGATFTPQDVIDVHKYDLIAVQGFRWAQVNRNTWGELKKLNPDILIFPYYGSHSNDNNDDQTNPYKGGMGRWNISRGHSMGNTNTDNPDLFYLTSSGKRIGAGPAWPRSWALDYGDPKVHQYWLEAYITDNVNKPWEADGVMVDTVPVRLTGLDGVPAGYSDAKWQADMQSYLNALSKGLANHNKIIWGNTGVIKTQEDIDAYIGLDNIKNPIYMGNSEGAFVSGWGRGDCQFVAERVWLKQVEVSRHIHQMKYGMQSFVKHERSGFEHSDTGTDNYGKSVTVKDALWYGLCSYHLGKNTVDNNTYFSFTANTYSDAVYYDEYNIDLGNAIGTFKVTNVGGNNIYYREFKKGYVYVNPTRNNVLNIHLPETCKQLTPTNFKNDPATTPNTTTIDLVSHRGTFLLKK